MSKKKTLEERREELRQAIGELLKANDRIFQLKMIGCGRLLTEEEQIEVKDLPYDVEVYCKQITKLKSKIKKMEEENAAASKRSGHKNAIQVSL